MGKRTTKQFKQLLNTLPSNSLWQDMWIVYSEGYNDAKNDEKKLRKKHDKMRL